LEEMEGLFLNNKNIKNLRVFMDSLNVRFADIGDIKDIFTWQNDELSRQMSFTTDLIEWEEHSKWYASSLSNADCCIFICYLADSGDKVCIVRFNIKKDAVFVSINLAPTMRGKGFAKPCLKKAIDFYLENNPSTKPIRAKIKSDNIVSLKSFEGVGFVYLREDDGAKYFEL